MNVAQGQINQTFRPCRPLSAEQLQLTKAYVAEASDLFDPVLRCSTSFLFAISHVAMSLYSITYPFLG